MARQPNIIWIIESRVKPFILPVQITNNSKALVLLYIQTDLYKLNEFVEELLKWLGICDLNLVQPVKPY